MWYYVLLLACSYSPLSQAQSLVLGGGGISDDNFAIWDAVVDLAGGPGIARLGIVTAASADPEDSRDYYFDLFLSRGAEEVYWVPVHEGNMDANSDPEVVDNINRMTGFFFGGGDQRRITNSFYLEGRVPSPALLAIQDVFAGGAVVGGSSAGMVAVVSAPMITGGYSWEALLYGAFEFDDPSMPRWTVEYDPDGGILVFDGYILDSHYSERGREGRLARLVLDTSNRPNGTPYGLGIDEDTALVVTNVGQQSETGEVVGYYGVMLVDTSGTSVDESGEYPAFADVVAHYLTPGDSINLVTHVPSFVNPDIAGRESLNSAPTSDEVFDGKVHPNRPPEFSYCATGMFDSPDDVTFGVTWEKNPEYQVDFYKTHPNAAGFKSDETGAISYQYLVFDMAVTSQ